MAKHLPFNGKLTDALTRAQVLDRPLVLTRVPEGLGPWIAAGMADKGARLTHEPDLVIVARDDNRAAEYKEAVAFAVPNAEIITLPAWDCLPYDRASPSMQVQSLRMSALATLCEPKTSNARLLITTVNALIQRLPTRASVKAQSYHAKAGQAKSMDQLVIWLQGSGYHRVGTVREKGDFAVRGGLVDLWPVADDNPYRLDFFGDSLESIRTFDPQSQLSVAQQTALSLEPWSEVSLDQTSISRFRKAYTGRFGTPDGDDLLYQAVREGRRVPGIEHWAPYFYEEMETLFDYTSAAPLLLDHLVDEALIARAKAIDDHFQAREDNRAERKEGPHYNPVPKEALYLDDAVINQALGRAPSLQLYAYQLDENAREISLDIEGRIGRSFVAERTQAENLFDKVVAYITEQQAERKRVVFASWSEGSRERMAGMLSDHGLPPPILTDTLAETLAYPKNKLTMCALGLEQGVDVDGLVVITEQDVLGERALAGRRRKRKSSDALTEASSLSTGDFIVHVDHGIGQFIGLKVVEALGVPHECLELVYAGGDRLFLPVENIELLSRYADEDALVTPDKLGGAAWQARKAKVKARIRDMAAKLMAVAAARELRTGIQVTPPEGLYDEFVARFPFEETEDQESAIEAVLDDFSKGRPMDRLVCGDVGFGKTEVALRAAFVMAMSGRQVAIVVPTTLLSRQHTHTFIERFKGLPIHIAQLSRFTTTAERKNILEGLQQGKVDIVVGTHAVLAKAVKFKDIGLLIIDEEQHFGVAHKEALKAMRAEVHVLTLTATPIPRTLQLALTGVRDLSLIATPPVDRLAVRTFISPFDEMAIREALLRELYRNGQSFFVCPRIADLGRLQNFLAEHVPEVKVITANGQMPPAELEQVIEAFYDGKFDVLLSTNIVESGLDVTNANTLIVYRADRFGLAQLYQLRGRVGRSKTRAYALFTTPADHQPTAKASKRLEVLQSLDTLGAGFQLASYDLDLRGSGNLLGEEQSGHIKEVGFELYQHMLEEAVAELKANPDASGEISDTWSPSLTLGISIVIPEHYIHDHSVRMEIYRDLATLEDKTAVEAYAAGLRDRFGPVPNEVENLLKVILIKSFCRQANIDRLDAGPQGIVIGFRKDTFAAPMALLNLIDGDLEGAKLRPDHRVVFKRNLRDDKQRLAAANQLASKLAKLASETDKEHLR